MDEFNKIKEVSDDIIGRKEPSFADEKEDDGDLYQFKPIEEEQPDILEENAVKSYRLHFIAMGVFVAILAIVLVTVFWIGEDKQPDKVITITATPNPVRIKPEQPGGSAIPDQDKQIYNRVNAQLNTSTKVEHLFPEPEQPVLPEILIKQATPDPTFVAVEDIKAVNPLDDVETPVVVVEEVPPTPKKEVMPLPAKKVVAETSKPATAPSKAKATPSSQQVWRIQLVSSSKKDSAEKAWATISKKYKSLLSDMSHDIVSAEIAGKGTFYRLQAGHFTTRDQAAALCTKLKAQKQECVPVKGMDQ